MMKTKRSANPKFLFGLLIAALVMSSSGQPLIAQLAPQKAAERLAITIPFMTTATATSPIAAQINWIDQEGAIGYDVLRNGAVIAELGSATRSHTDATLRPNTTYTYQVRTRRTTAPGPVTPQTITPPGAGWVPQTGPAKLDPSAPAPRTTAPVQVTTPRALAPVPVTAKTVSAAAAKISWSPRPETLNYLITRIKQPSSAQNIAQPIRVTAAPTSGFYTDQNLPAGTYTYTVQSLMRAGDGAEVLGEPSRPVQLLVRPFNIIAIGDSIMWGQGLSEDHKFVTKVQQWLQSQFGPGKEVRLRNFARSGALVRLQAANVEAQFAGERGTIFSEIPRDTPSVMYQGLYLAPGPGVDPYDVDLVLMDGCANEVNLKDYVLNPTVSEATLGARIQDKCGGDPMSPTSMVHNLGEIHGRFPNAKILLTGYYPMISQGSPLDLVALLLQHVGIFAGGAAAGIGALFGIPIDPITGAIVGAVAMTIESKKLLDTEASHSVVFQATTTSTLSTSVAIANQRFGQNRIRFVGVPFTPATGYAMPGSWLWLVPAPVAVAGVPNSKDEVYDQRAAACSAAHEGSECVFASMGHPNVTGAQIYATSIIAALPEFMNGWRAVHATTTQTSQ